MSKIEIKCNAQSCNESFLFVANIFPSNNGVFRFEIVDSSPMQLERLNSCIALHSTDPYHEKWSGRLVESGDHIFDCTCFAGYRAHFDNSI